MTRRACHCLLHLRVCYTDKAHPLPALPSGFPLEPKINTGTSCLPPPNCILSLPEAFFVNITKWTSKILNCSLICFAYICMCGCLCVSLCISFYCIYWGRIPSWTQSSSVIWLAYLAGLSWGSPISDSLLSFRHTNRAPHQPIFCFKWSCRVLSTQVIFAAPQLLFPMPKGLHKMPQEACNFISKIKK